MLYLPIAIAEVDWESRHFRIGDDHLEVGLAPAQMLFARVVRVLVPWLRLQGVHLQIALRSEDTSSRQGGDSWYLGET